MRCAGLTREGVWCGCGRILVQVRALARSVPSLTDRSKYPKARRERGRTTLILQFADRIHEALVDIFGEKGRGIKTYLAEVRDGLALQD